MIFSGDYPRNRSALGVQNRCIKGVSMKIMSRKGSELELTEKLRRCFERPHGYNFTHVHIYILPAVVAVGFLETAKGM